ncbi:MAG: S8 family serine peptidase [Pseudomonadota bacterium]
MSIQAWLSVVLLALAAAGCAVEQQLQQQSSAPVWRVTAADKIAGPRDLILTVAQQDPDGLAAMAEALAAKYNVELVAEWPLSAIDVHCIVFRAAEDADLDALIASMSRDDTIRTVQRMQTFSTLGVTYPDELFALQTGLQQINAPSIHQASTGDRVRVAVLDTGVDFSHPDLTRRQALARDFVGAPPGTYTPELHGTAIAGVIAADGRNGLGIVGVAPDAEILGLRGCWQDPQTMAGVCSTFSLARALNFALNAEVQILNLSLAGPFDPLLAELVEAAAAKGMVLIAASGTAPGQNFPASQPGVIAVSSLAGQGKDALAAPGNDILSTRSGGGYDFFSGSSVAAAHMSGVAALLLQSRPRLSPQEMREALQDAAQSTKGRQDGVLFDSCAAFRTVAPDQLDDPC